MRAAMRRNQRPFALCANAVPITSVVSPRRGCSSVGSRMWVVAQSRCRTRRGRTVTVAAPSARTVLRARTPIGQCTAAARAAHDGVGEPGLGVLGSADDDHCRTLRSRCISVAEYALWDAAYVLGPYRVRI